MSRFKLFFSSVWGFLQPFVALFLTKAGPLLAAAAISAVKVTAASLQEADGAQKREHAFNLIMDDLKRQGVAMGAEVTTSMVNAAIEVAVQKVKADRG